MQMNVNLAEQKEKKNFVFFFSFLFAPFRTYIRKKLNFSQNRTMIIVIREFSVKVCLTFEKRLRGFFSLRASLLGVYFEIRDNSLTCYASARVNRAHVCEQLRIA